MVKYNDLKRSNLRFICRLCRGNDFLMVKPGNIDNELSSELFAVTESGYGKTGALYRCSNCNLLQCQEINDPLPFYQALNDPEYDEGAIARSLQMKSVLRIIQRFQRGGRLLDIGAASGLLVDLALASGHSAQGIEPSASFQAAAAKKGLPVHLGTFPNAGITGRFNIITLIDVIEHVIDPVGLLQNIENALTARGICVIVTPDVSSIAARVLGWNWWHFRVAHITYFNRQTLELALRKAGLIPIFFQRPAWYFPADYLLERIKKYLPNLMPKSLPKALHKIIIPVNPFDSMLIVAQKEDALMPEFSEKL